MAAGDLEAARRAVGELEETAELYRTPALAAAAEHARGSYELSADDTAEVQRRLASALRLWHPVHAPYDAARARVLLGEAYLARGDRDSGLLELRTAQTAFERLGACPDAERTEGRLLALRR